MEEAARKNSDLNPPIKGLKVFRTGALGDRQTTCQRASARCRAVKGGISSGHRPLSRMHSSSISLFSHRNVSVCSLYDALEAIFNSVLWERSEVFFLKTPPLLVFQLTCTNGQKMIKSYSRKHCIHFSFSGCVFPVWTECTVFKIELNCSGHFSYVYFSCKAVKFAKLTRLLSRARCPPKNNVMADWVRHLSHDLEWWLICG